ncbi:hypothetical protein CN568_20125 [Bacillus pseudomycoides]|uniref:thiamine pyrophosphate-binding protein n=1 Tax=Bacillus TaxID=1386 RepID=UPI000BF00823|nr:MULTISPECIES: thiamine pyrophosphate-binding protein [Bacillus]MCX2829640.1 thiamine pyrophosphate-binding protein [Bacillus sp. DHT2]MDR4916755.1 thiamine pyrophosphate-binding protein [Bacillus pseudomycoides]PEK32367.1 hypothetical protein CN691_16080 [Bacillus pseudomycoides]PEK67979.1 hypothetical protein CN593_13290 [Bacillus pseudomycoides]PEP38625.1 hypothetical protein CN565_24805 [Bacillus pseudomycoides]
MDILDYLKNEKIKINAVPGAHILPLYKSAETKLDYSNLISWRTEYGAGFGALGNIQSTGLPAIVVSTAGPGITSMISHVAQANAEFLPLIAIGVNNYSWDLDQRKGLIHELPDSRPLFRDITYDCLRIESGSEFVDYLTRCISKMKNGQCRPVYIEIPSNIISEIVEFTFEDVNYGIPVKKNIESYISEVIKEIKTCKFPVIYIGWGAHLSNSGQAICELAKKMGAIVITTLKGKGAIPDSFSLNAGCIWERARPFDAIAEKSDFVLALGTSLSLLETRNAMLPIDGKVYHVANEGAMLKKNYKNSKTLNCDINEFLCALLPKVSQVASEERLKELEGLCENIKEQWYDGLKRTVPEVWQVVNSIRNNFDIETQFSLDMCQDAYWLTRYLKTELPFSIHMPNNFGTLGGSLPSAIGAAVCGKDVVCITGDGGFSYGFTEISTALKYNIPIKVILFNNNLFGSVDETHTKIYKSKNEHFQLTNPDYKKLAESFGIDYYFAENDSLNDVLAKANSVSNSFILEVRTKGLPMFNGIIWPEWKL